MLRSVLALSAICVSASTAFSQALMVPQAQPPRLVVVAPATAQAAATRHGRRVYRIPVWRSARSRLRGRSSRSVRFTPISIRRSARGRSRCHAGLEIDPRYLRREVAFDGPEAPGTIVIDTPNKFLYLVQPGGRAMRYGIGVGRPGFTWAGTHKVTCKERMAGLDSAGGNAAAAARSAALHARRRRAIRSARARSISARRSTASTAPTRPGRSASNVSSGCIRMRNADVDRPLRARQGRHQSRRALIKPARRSSPPAIA